MIKEKHEKGSDGVKEEPCCSDKDSPSTEVRIKKEDDPTVSTSNLKKEHGRSITKNGGVIGSTNMGSLHKPDLKTEKEETTPVTEPSATLKSEDLETDLPSDSFPINLPSTGNVSTPDGIQMLSSNVVTKQSSNMEVQYMQQQSQIFVFSTTLANSGADEVMQGRYPSMIAFHCAQPGTKKFLEKNPLKITQFNRQNPAQWLNNLTIMKHKSCNRSPGLTAKSQPTLDNFLVSDSLDDMVALSNTELPWEHKNNHQLDALDSVSNGLPDVQDMDPCSTSLGNVQPSLQGVKVPDENLTPQQRQHREEQLATIRKMQQMLFPENQGIETPVSLPSGTNPNPIPCTVAATSVGPLSVGPATPSECMEMQGNMHQGSAPPNIPVSTSANSSSLMPTMEWQKLQQQFSIDNKSKSISRTGSATGPRLQGPPPPYHQTPRSASVPIALQSPNPASPNNPTSNLSLPSPRASSALNSPADSNRPFGLTRHISTGQSPTSQDSPSRHNHSNPSTPVSSHLSPSISTADPPVTNSQSTAVSASGTSSTVKEPNLMPVPSPQQIQYLNTFEGQELIIQKQPNTSLKEGNIISPPLLPTTMDSGFSGSTDMPHSRISGPSTPTPVDVGPRFPGTPSDGCRFQIPSPQTPTGTADKIPRLTGPNTGAGLSPQTSGAQIEHVKKELFHPSSSPHMIDVPRFPGPSASPSAKISNFVNVSPSGKPSSLDLPSYGCGRGDNVPLNPNSTNVVPGNTKVSHFDPISSLAQMSQQLTNSVSSLNGQGAPGGPNMMNFGSSSMHMLEMGNCHAISDMDQAYKDNVMGMQMQGPSHVFHSNSPRSSSPKLQGAFPNHMPMPRMMGRPPGPNPYNGTNVQVKPNAPNTIQYMPTKPQVGNAPGPRGPLSLEFLQRFANPLGNMDNKIPTQNLQYFPNCGSNNTIGGANPGGPMPGHMPHMDGPPMPDNGPMGVGPMMGSSMGNGSGPMMATASGTMIGPGMMSMMRPMRPPPGMIRMPQMGFNGPSHSPNLGGVPGGSGPPEGMFNPLAQNMQNPGSQMFVSGPKGSPMSINAPDATQPLPPSMGQNNTFKNSSFVGPTTADPNYAQQFHNFQQQLYATNTRSQMGGQAMGPGPGPPHVQQTTYFNPK